MIDLINLISEDNNLIVYRPSLREIGKSVTGTILLSQIIFRWKNNDRKPFYKFKEPCRHELYKEGDSWIEELGFSKKEFDSALKNIAIKKNAKNKEEKHNFPIEYFIKNDRTTWYNVNEGNLHKLLNGIYVNHQRGFTKSTKGDLLITTTETTTDIGENEFSQSSIDFPDKDSSLESGLSEKEKVTQKRKSSEPKVCLFENSKFYDFDDFKEQFKEQESTGVDVGYYYHAVKDWSASKGKKMKDWIATTRNFMRSDSQKGNLKMIISHTDESEQKIIDSLNLLG